MNAQAPSPSAADPAQPRLRLPPAMQPPLKALRQLLLRMVDQANSRNGCPVEFEVRGNLDWLMIDLEHLADSISRHHGSPRTCRAEVEEALRHTAEAAQALHTAYLAKLSGKEPANG